MGIPRAGNLSPIEKEVAAEVRALRKSSQSDLNSSLLERPARLANHLIQMTHGNAQLRLSWLAREIGIEKRRLERTFAVTYKKTMIQFQVEVRLAFSKHLLSVFPPNKISVIAAILGYDAVQDFNRFFKKHTQQSPSEWGRKERERIALDQGR